MRNDRRNAPETWWTTGKLQINQKGHRDEKSKAINVKIFPWIINNYLINQLSVIKYISEWKK